MGAPSLSRLHRFAELKRGEHGRKTTLPPMSEIRDRTDLSRCKFIALLLGRPQRRAPVGRR